MTTTSAAIFNHAILSYIVLFFSREQLFTRLEAGLSFEQLVAAGYERRRIAAVMRIAHTMGIVGAREGAFYLTGLGKELARDQGLFTVILGGYGRLLGAMDIFMTRSHEPSLPYVRGDAVAIGSDQAHQRIMRERYEAVIDRLPGRRFADLGCGNAGRLVELLQRRPEVSGVGIDIDTEAVKLANRNRQDHGLTSRLTIIHEDVFSSLSRPRPELAEVDVVMSFMMLHDLFSKQEPAGQVIRRLKAAFPNARSFVLADTCRDERTYTAGDAPVFTQGFELVHVMRGIELFPLRHYETEFEQGGLKLVARHELGVPNTYLFVLEA